jgi:hypothetical protein
VTFVACSKCGREWLTPWLRDRSQVYLGPCCRGDFAPLERRAKPEAVSANRGKAA